MICAPCGHENAANRRFCGGCGAALPAERVLAARPARPTTPAVPVAVRSVAAVAHVAAPHAAPAVASVHAPAPMLAVAPPPAPGAPPIPPPLPIKGRAEDLLSSSELSDLLRRPAAPVVAASEGTDLPEGSITQESLDALFGG